MFAFWWSCIRVCLLRVSDIELRDSTTHYITHRDITHRKIRLLRHNSITTYCHHNIRPLLHFASTSFCHCIILQTQNMQIQDTNIVLPRHFAIQDIVPSDILPTLTSCNQDVLQNHGHCPMILTGLG